MIRHQIPPPGFPAPLTTMRGRRWGGAGISAADTSLGAYYRLWPRYRQCCLPDEARRDMSCYFVGAAPVPRVACVSFSENGCTIRACAFT